MESDSIQLSHLPLYSSILKRVGMLSYIHAFNPVNKTIKRRETKFQKTTIIIKKNPTLTRRTLKDWDMEYRMSVNSTKFSPGNGSREL